MRKVCLVLASLFLCIDGVNAALRVQNTATPSSARQLRTKTETTQSRSVSSRSATVQETSRKTTARAASNKVVSGRTATNKKTTARATAQTSRLARAAASVKTRTFGENYNSCRDAYFTCMDQFCATQNDDYRRCVCSSRLSEIQNGEKRLSQTESSLQDFHDLNIDVISKTSGEVKAMVSASEGENAIKKDSSKTQKMLNNISGILKKTKQQSLSTSGTLDVAGNIRNIWTTTDFITGTDIANLTGEPLYNAVHAQCSEMVKPNCTNQDLKMIVSAYGMYIENDCSVLAAKIDSQITSANADIRSTRHKMQDARLENYDAHNSLSVNECIARVRQDITAPTACGEGYIHCLDFTGKYLNFATGEPIYSADFYQIENMLSLDGNVLKNNTNKPFITMLNKKRSFAEQSLDLCTDDADAVWNEFLHQSIVEIYQAQQQRVQQVKSECLAVVNTCYLNKSDTLKEFSDNSSLITLGHTLELSEDLCADKLTTCSNLYGGGPEGLAILVDTMMHITDETIAQTCPELLTTFAQNICAVSANDSGHSYPYGCRVYAPGEAFYAQNAICNMTLVNPFSRSDILVNRIIPETNYMCPNMNVRYKRCEFNYYLYNENGTPETCFESATGTTYNPELKFCSRNATECHVCPAGYICPGGLHAPQNANQDLYDSCGLYYIGSLYQQLVRYALQNCVRPSSTTYVLPENILADVNNAMNAIKSVLIRELASECDIYDGTWIDIPWTDDNFDGHHDLTGDTLLESFYSATGTNKLWGYCRP